MPDPADWDYEAKFAALGNTPDAVAESLRSKGIRGLCHNGPWCPLAIYAHRIGIKRAWVEERIVTGDGIEPPVRLPKACRQFVRRFDRYEYPELLS